MSARFSFNQGLDELCRSVVDVVDAICNLPDDFWRRQPEGYFGSGEQIVHIVQSAKFASKFIREQVGLQLPTGLPAVFKEAAYNHTALSALNLEGARRVLAAFPSEGQFKNWVLTNLTKVESDLIAIPEDCYDKQVNHPLVAMVGPCGVVLNNLITMHFPYHLGQVTQMMKEAGHADAVPPLRIFGSFLS